MEKNRFLPQLASKDSTSNVDYDAPFSFIEWKRQMPLYIESDVLYHYNQYVLDWFSKKKTDKISTKFLLRQKYLYLLEQLQMFFTVEEKQTWYQKINLSDEKELLLAIPYFAKKLKDISLYYLKLRKKLKNTKLKYNLVGTSSGIQQDLYSFLLNNFSKANTELHPNIDANLPELSDMQKRLVVEIQELFDDTNYFDRSSSSPLSSHFDLFHPLTTDFFASKGIVLSSAETVFNTFDVPVVKDLETALNVLTGNVFETTETDLYELFLEKYISENKFTISFGLSSPVTTVTDINITKGNNFFYYPYNITDQSIAISQKIPSVPLSGISFSTFGNAGINIDTADTIFVKNGTNIKAAWLQKKIKNISQQIMNAEMIQGEKNSFIFPYPGFGLSSDGLTWTGSSLSTVQEYTFLTKEEKASVDQEYWTQALSSIEINPLYINNTTLTECGALPGNNSEVSDKIYIFTDRTEVITEPLTQMLGAWLYNFQKTSLPVLPNNDNVFLWPYAKLSVEDDSEYPAHYSSLNFKTVCEDIKIEDLTLPYACAAPSITQADKIYKLNNFKDPIEQAVECIWLSGNTETNGVNMFVSQDNFSGLFDSGKTVRFIWTGPTTNVKDVFTSLKHDHTCPLFNDSTEFFAASASMVEACSCKQNYYSPFGHNGETFDDNSRFADFIAKDFENNNLPFDIMSWKDSVGNNYKSSDHFVWFKTFRQAPSWGYGNWITTKNNAPFSLEPGKAYFYGRVAEKRSSNSLCPYIINYTFSTKKAKWIKARKDTEGNWQSTNEPAETVLKAGNFVKYERAQSCFTTLLSTTVVENETQNKGSVWTTFDYIALGSVQNYALITWPTNDPPIGMAGTGQYPSFSYTQISAFDNWEIINADTGFIENVIYNEEILSFTPSATGRYQIIPTVLLDNGTLVSFTNVPLISVVPSTGYGTAQLEQSRSLPGFLIEHQLTRKIYGVEFPGAKPYWATFFVDKQPENNLKSAIGWGFAKDFIDGYIPHHSPVLSPLQIAFGNIIDYQRNDKLSLIWNQPLEFKEDTNVIQWKKINIDTTNVSTLSNLYNLKASIELITEGTDEPTDIILTNNLNGKAVEVYYNAVESFVWPVSVTTIRDIEPANKTTTYISAKSFLNFSNRFFPAIASVPVLENSYSIDDVGGYFTPLELGASHFINKNFTPFLLDENIEGSYLTENTDIHIGGRGLSKEDQPTMYSWSEDNQWIKESITTGVLAGSVKKDLTKTLQTFVPYDSNNLRKSYGIFTPNTPVTPWGGKLHDEWIDTKNEPKGFTGVRSVTAWSQNQPLLNFNKIADKWNTDIFGNQYSLYKTLDDVAVSHRTDVFGELWVKSNEGKTEHSRTMLSAVYEPFNNNTTRETIYNNLTGSGIRNFDTFYETLMFELSVGIILAKVNYDYSTNQITSVYDDTRFISLTASNAVVNPGQTWFFQDSKKLIVLTTTLSSNRMIPTLYELNLVNRALKIVFPINKSDTENIVSSLSSVEISSLDKGLLSYNTVLKKFVITYKGKRTDGEMFIINFNVENIDGYVLSQIDLYNPDNLFSSTAFNVNMPPVVLADQLTARNVGSAGTTFFTTVTALNFPVLYELLNYKESLQVSNTGTFFGKITATPGVHHVNYAVSNLYGTSKYCLTLITT